MGAGEGPRAQRRPPHLTYPALLLGYREVAEAMRDPQVPVLLERFLDKVVLPLLERRAM